MGTQALAFSNSDNSGNDVGCADNACRGLTGQASNSPTAVMGAVVTKCSPMTWKAKNVASKGDGTADARGKGVNVQREKDRRNKLKAMYSGLQALLPQLPEEASKSKIVDEALSYIKTLQDTLKELQKRKMERIQQANPPAVSGVAFKADQVRSWPEASSSAATSASLPPAGFQTWSSPNVVVSVAGEDAYINICTTPKPNLLSAIVEALDKHKLEVVSAHVSSDGIRSFFMIHAHAKSIPNQPLQEQEIEESFKLAATEIIVLISE